MSDPVEDANPEDPASLEQRALALGSTARALVTWLVDIDGVLNVIGKKPTRSWGDHVRTSVMSGDGFMWPITYSPRLVRILNALHRSGIVRFVWLTTWEDDAHRLVAPALGLDIGRQVLADLGVDESDWWKLDHVREQARRGEEFIVWVDDDIHEFVPRPREQLRDLDGRCLVFCPDQTQGLAPGEVDVILEVIESLVRDAH